MDEVKKLRKGHEHGRRHGDKHHEHHRHHAEYDKDYFLQIDNLTVEYTSAGETVHAVNNVSLKVREGKTLGLVGETGAGKTTIAKTILRVLPDTGARVVDGDIYLQGENLLEASEKRMLKIRGDKISMIFQDPMTALNGLMTVGSQIEEAIMLHNDITRDAAVERTCKMLEMVGIPRVRYNEYPHQFSGGMKQRVVIAMALACHPRLLLADEPTTALDVTIQAQILDLIRDLQREFNTSMILITHDLGVIAETCDDVAVIYAGQIVESGSKAQLFLNPKHPYTLGLFGSLPKLDDDSKRLSPIPGLPPDPTNLPKGCPFAPRCPHATETCREAPVEVREIESGHFVSCILAEKEA